MKKQPPTHRCKDCANCIPDMGYLDKFGKPILGKCPFEGRSMLLNGEWCVKNFKEK